MPNYYRVMLGPAGSHAKEAIKAGYIGVHYDVLEDLSRLSNEKTFREKISEKLRELDPSKPKSTISLTTTALWQVAFGFKDGDIIVAPIGKGKYRIARVDGTHYSYHPDAPLVHQRKVIWEDKEFVKASASPALVNSMGSLVTIIDITRYEEEIEALLGQRGKIDTVAENELLSSDPVIFVLEKHLEDFIVGNWKHTLLGENYDIYTDENAQVIGQQFPTVSGPIDILAQRKDGSELLVIELKKGKISDVVVGQILRYIGFIQNEVAKPGQLVKGVVIALEDDRNLRLALNAAPNVDFYRYEVNFALKYVETNSPILSSSKSDTKTPAVSKTILATSASSSQETEKQRIQVSPLEGKMRAWAAAAYKVMPLTGEPMQVREILKLIQDENLDAGLHGKTPENTLGRDLGVEADKPNPWIIRGEKKGYWLRLEVASSPRLASLSNTLSRGNEKSKNKRIHHEGTIQDLLNAGLLQPADILVSTNALHPAEAIVYADGQIEVEGIMYATPSQAAKMVRGGAVNGWKFWAVDTIAGKRTLAQLREQLFR